MTYLRVFLFFLFTQMINVGTGGSPTHLGISLKLNIKNRNKVSQICTTAACNNTAELLLKYMDFEADPCKDFYQFTCGSIISKEIPPGKSHSGSLVNVREDFKRNIKSILEEPPSEAKDNFEKQTKMSFQACVDTTAIENGGVKVIKEVLKKFGGWPLVEGDKWKEEECNLTTIFTMYNLYGILSIFNVVIIEYPAITPPDLPIPDDHYKENSTALGIYKKFVLDASLYFGEIEKNDNFIKAVDDIIAFGRSLSECQLDLPGIINVTTMEALKKIFEKTFDIESFFKSFYKNAGRELAPNEAIGTFKTPYINCLARHLEVTSKRTIVNYLVWNFIQSSSAAMPKQFVELSNTFKSKIDSPSKNITRWESCCDMMTDSLDKVVGHLYVVRHFTQASKKKALDLLQRIKHSFKRLIAQEKWLTKESKVSMIAKIEQTADCIGYPDYMYDPRLFDDDFNGVDFSGQSFLEIFLALNMLKVKDSLKLMNKRDPNLFPITFINGLHHEAGNTIIFTPGILSQPYYSESFPMSLNFGGIGNTMGHEITHALGVIGHKVVLNGVTRELWEGETRENFLKRSDCLINQFDGIPTSSNLKLNGNNTKAENIADAGGLRIAYMAYKRWLKEYGEEKQLPGIPYNSEQMYFISMGMSFCRKYANETLEYKLTNAHPPHRIRVNMVMKNFKTFSKVFKCKANSEMNLSERCRVW